MRAAVDRILTDHGALGVLVNNAGYALRGPVETTPLGDARARFFHETNVFGHSPADPGSSCRRACGPQSWGHEIVFLSSIYERSPF